MSNESAKIQGRVPDQIKTEFDQYAEERGDLSQSEALRHVLGEFFLEEKADDRGFAEKVTRVDVVIVAAIVVFAELYGAWAFAGVGLYAVALYWGHRRDTGRSA